MRSSRPSRPFWPIPFRDQSFTADQVRQRGGIAGNCFGLEPSFVSTPSPRDVVEYDGAATPLWKRVLDLVLIVLLLPILLPALAVIAVFVRVSSPGPLLFRQTRIGRNGIPFICYKFRTMKLNACTDGHERHLTSLITSNAPMHKLDHRGDSRIILGGRLLRSSGLDELPQLFNVVRGEMSIAGPRPCLPYEFALYSDRHKQRLAVLPGITGLWQVAGKNRTTFEEMIDLDLAYVRRLSFAQDLMILLRTVVVVVRQLSESLNSMHLSQAAQRPASASGPG